MSFPFAARNGPSSGFIGRHREMAELARALGEAVSGHGRLIMLAGEPGIGKTRTVQEFAALVSERGAYMLWGRCYEGGGTLPYWPWTQCIRACMDQMDTALLRSRHGSALVNFAEIVPELLADLGPGLRAPPPDESPEQARFRLFHSIAAFFRDASSAQPLVLVLEDLHWADRPSLLLLEFLAPTLADSRVLLLGTYRATDIPPGHPLSLTLGSLVREQHFQRIHLHGFSEEEVAEFVLRARKSGLSPALVKALYERTQGNPLFVTEIVRLLDQQGSQDEHLLQYAIPEGIRDAIGRRLGRLSEVCRQVLATASVLGREFELKVLEKLHGDILQEDLLDALDEAQQTHVIEVVPGTAGRYHFSHVLVQQTLMEWLPPTRRARLHADVVVVMEELLGSAAPSHAAELAYHCAEARAVIGSEKFVRYSLLAGERALAAHAYEEALGHFERALAAREGQPGDADTAAILLGLGRAMAATLQRDRLQDAVVTLGHALKHYAAVGDVTRVVSAADVYMQPVEGLTTIARLAAMALKVVPPDSHEAARLLCRPCGRH